MQAALDEIPSLAQAARVGGAWQTDGSRHTVGSRLTGEDLQDGTLLVPPREGRTTLRVCYLFSGVKRKASIGEELKKMCLKEGIGLRMFEVLATNHLRTQPLSGTSGQNQLEVICKPCILTKRSTETTVTCHHTLHNEAFSDLSIPEPGIGWVLNTVCTPKI